MISTSYSRSPEGVVTKIIDLNPIVARHLVGHYYWMRRKNTYYGYNLLATTDRYVLDQGLCSVFNPPITEICPDQITEDEAGNLKPNYDYKQRSVLKIERNFLK